jgi:hypothetical protein
MAAEITVDFPDPTLDETEFVVLEMTRPMSPGLQHPEPGDFRFIVRLAGDELPPQDVTSSYMAVFGTFAAGMVIWARAYVIDSLKGQPSLPVMTSVVVS